MTLRLVSNFKPIVFPLPSHRQYGVFVRRKDQNVKFWAPKKAIWQAAFGGNLNEMAHFYNPRQRMTTCYINFYYSEMCARSVAEKNPDLYCEIHKIKHGDEHYAKFQAWRIKKRILEESQHGKQERYFKSIKQFVAERKKLTSPQSLGYREVGKSQIRNNPWRPFFRDTDV